MLKILSAAQSTGVIYARRNRVSRRALAHDQAALIGLSPRVTEKDILAHPVLKKAVSVRIHDKYRGGFTYSRQAMVQFSEAAHKREALLKARRLFGNCMSMCHFVRLNHTGERVTQIPITHAERRISRQENDRSTVRMDAHFAMDSLILSRLPPSVTMNDIDALEIDGFVEGYIWDVAHRKLENVNPKHQKNRYAVIYFETNEKQKEFYEKFDNRRQGYSGSPLTIHNEQIHVRSTVFSNPVVGRIMHRTRIRKMGEFNTPIGMDWQKQTSWKQFEEHTLFAKKLNIFPDIMRLRKRKPKRLKVRHSPSTDSAPKLKHTTAVQPKKVTPVNETKYDTPPVLPEYKLDNSKSIHGLPNHSSERLPPSDDCQPPPEAPKALLAACSYFIAIVFIIHKALHID